MKLFNNSCFILLSSVLSMITTNGKLKVYEYIDTNIGPFEVRKNKTSNLAFEYKMDVNARVYEYIDVFVPNKGWVESKTTNTFDYHGQIRNVSFDMPVSKYMTLNGLRILFEVRNSKTDEPYVDIDCFLYPIDTKTLNPFINNDYIYESLPYAYDTIIGGDCYARSKYDFHNLINYTVDTDNRYFDFPNCSFDYIGRDSFTYKEAYISFYDSHNLFPKYRTSSDGFKHIPLYIVPDKEVIKIGMKRDYYLNAETMEISDIYRSGYERVDNFYLPKNFKHFKDDYMFEVNLIDIGEDRLDVIYPIELGSYKNFLGLCNNSEFCITGQIEK